ncbi:MAG TPA: metalloenzyme [Meiothermus sp.]|nr:metalloenzyme [Meiothermus sp.]
MLAFLFVDGLGLSDDPRSLLQTLELPTLRALTRDFSSQPFAGERTGIAQVTGQAGIAFGDPLGGLAALHWAYRVLDATLGVEGLPQSGTGQTTLLTGTNAAEVLGHHQGPHPLSRLQGLLREQSLQVWGTTRGLEVVHANGYRQEYLERTRTSRRNMLSAFAYAARAAGLELRSLEDPLAIAPAFWAEPEKAGERLARLAERHDWVVLENWALDYFAHREPDLLPERFTELDRFLRGWLEANPAATLLLTSDHGNSEEPWHPQHTRNPVPLLVVGPLASTVPPMSSLTDVAPWVRSVLGK